MLRLVFMSCAAWLLAIPFALAQGAVDLARQALDAGDFAALETLLARETENAREAHDFSSLRNIYGTLFKAANSKRLARQQAWLADYPDSPYAAAALGWSYLHLSDLARGTASLRHTSDEALAEHRRKLTLSVEMTDRALTSVPDFVPALDVAIQLARFAGGQAAVPSMVRRSLAAYPDSLALSLGMMALSPRWGGSRDQSLALCYGVKTTLAGFDGDTCLIFGVFSDGVEGELRRKALAALEGKDEAFLDFARSDAYRNEWRGRPEAASESWRILMDRIGPGMPVDAVDRELRQVSRTFPDAIREAEAKAAFLAALKQRVPDTPENYRILRYLLADVLQRSHPDDPPDRADEARALWKAMLVNGTHNPDVWEAGEQIEFYLGNWAKPAVMGPYVVNAIYYSNHSANTLRRYVLSLLQLHEMAGRPELLPAGTTLADLGDDVLLCPMFRAQRLLDAVCRLSPDDLGCNVVGAAANGSAEVRRLMARTEACHWEREAAIEDLPFQPVEAARFLDQN